MPGPTTYYRRIQVVLELSASKEYYDAEQFLEEIEKKSPPNFVYYRWDSKKKERIGIASAKAIRNTFYLAVDFDLLERGTGKLTKAGKSAADPARFESIVSEQLEKLFTINGFSIERLEIESGVMLRGNPIVLPTADELYNKIFKDQEQTIGILKFRTLMRLLASCGGIGTTRRQLFLPRKQ